MQDAAGQREPRGRPRLAEPVERLIAGAPPPSAGAPGPELRALVQAAEDRLFEQSGGVVPEVGSVDDHRVQVDGGEIAVRCYRPEGDGPWPAFVHVHGGGFALCSIDMLIYDAKCRDLCNRVGCVVLAPEYRLAPEHTFPTAPHDVLAAWEWLLANADLLGVDRRRIAVGGDSAGGNLSAVLCLMARDRRLAQPVLQVLEIPALDLATTLDWPSARAFGVGYGLEAETVEATHAVYIPDKGSAAIRTRRHSSARISRGCPAHTS